MSGTRKWWFVKVAHQAHKDALPRYFKIADECPKTDKMGRIPGTLSYLVDAVPIADTDAILSLLELQALYEAGALKPEKGRTACRLVTGEMCQDTAACAALGCAVLKSRAPGVAKGGPVLGKEGDV